MLIQWDLELPRKDWASVSLGKLTFKVGDFGFSRFIPEVLVTMSEVGTTGFWAPEITKVQANGRKRYGPPVDIYSTGVIGFMLACERQPGLDEGT